VVIIVVEPFFIRSFFICSNCLHMAVRKKDALYSRRMFLREDENDLVLTMILRACNDVLCNIEN